MHARMFFSCLCCGVLLSGVALAQNLSNADKEFIKMAAVTNMKQAHVGEMAQDQAANSDVKDFGQTLVKDHTDAYDRLAKLADKTGVAIPRGIDAARIPAIESLSRLKGKNFDRSFLEHEVAAQRSAIAEFRREASHGQDQDLKNYASQCVSTLENDLKTAQSLEKSTRRRG
jgi:putative membrane protein